MREQEDLPSPVHARSLRDWFLFVATRSSANRFSRWRVVTVAEMARWAPMRRGAYCSIQAYPEPPEVGRCRGRMHHSLFWLEFDAPSLLESCRAAYFAVEHMEGLIHPPAMLMEERFTIRYSGNRSIHLGVRMGAEPSEHLTDVYKRLAIQWKDSGAVRWLDTGIYTNPRLLPCAGSIRWDTGRKILVLSFDDLLVGCSDPDVLIRRSEEEAKAGRQRSARGP